ncbi:MAG: hypothetical protein OHK0019_17110 [Saprospiraceae bacterium]
MNFDGFVLGSLQTLSIARAKAATWESCINNVSAVALFYRVYEQGFPGGDWESLDLNEDYNTLVGPYTTRYRSKNADISLTNGLTAGKIYVLEVYFRAEVDTVGDDFIPETTLLQNNGGQNYHFTFQYGGVSAPPFLIVPTKIVDVKCNGDSTGVAGITVYGDQSGLFYQWSIGGNNFNILSKIPAGTYSVTVTGAGGYSASDTMVIAEPEPLAVDFMVAGIGCNGSDGMAWAFPLGGTTPYSLIWENGSQDSMALFPNSGEVGLTLTDGNGCSEVFSTEIPAAPVVSLDVEAQICFGETYLIGGLTIAQPGFFEVELPGANGDCDTLVHLNLTMLPPLDANLEYDEVAPYACSPDDSIHLLLKVLTNAQEPFIEWTWNGQIVATADAFLMTIPGGGVSEVAIPFFTVRDKFGCVAYSSDTIISVSQPLPLQVDAFWTHPNGGLDNGLITLQIVGGSPSYDILWDNGATTSSIENLGTGTYCATVTDGRNCSVVVCVILESSGVSDLSLGSLLKIYPNPAASGQELTILLPEDFVGQEVLFEILDLHGRTLLRQITPQNQMLTQLISLEKWPAGVLIVKSTSSDGKSAIGRLTVH